MTDVVSLHNPDRVGRELQAEPEVYESAAGFYLRGSS